MPEIVPHPKDEDKQWTLYPLSSSDLEEIGDERERMIRRRDSSDNLFAIVPDCAITKIGDGDKGRILTPLTRVLASAGLGETVGIALDNELLILDKKRGFDNNPRRIRFDANVDFLLWRRSIILVGLSNSEIVLVDPNTFQVKESKRVVQKVPGDGRFFVDAAIHSNPNPTKIDVIAVGVDGVVYAFHDISLSDGVLDTTHDQNTSVDIDIGTVRGTRMRLLDREIGTEVVCVSSPSRTTLVLGETNGVLSIHDIEEQLTGIRKPLKIWGCENVVQSRGFGESTTTIRKLQHFEGLFFILFSNGTLEFVLDDVLFSTGALKLPQDDYIVHDFALILNGEGEVKLWVLYGTPDFSRNSVGIFGGPSFTLEFSLRIPFLATKAQQKIISKLSFPNQATPFEEPFAFIEVSNCGTAIYRMLETSTELTIQKLLAAGKFDQAADLARQCGKDMDIVYKAKCRFTLAKLLADIRGDKAEIVFEEMIETLEKVKDASFVCEFCIQNGLRSLEWLRKLLGVGRLRVKDCSLSASGKNLLLVVKKFFTFEQVFPKASIVEWVQFNSPDNTMFQQCKRFLAQLEFANCEKIWRRHFDEFIPFIKLEDFGPFFLVLFGQRLGTEAAISLFKCILPFAVEKCAETHQHSSSFSEYGLSSFQLAKVEMLMGVAKRQVCSLERERNWPAEAIDFSKTLISTVQQSMDIVALAGSRGRLDLRTSTQLQIYKEILTRIEDILQNLVELSDLRQNHSIRLPFLQYFEDDVFEVVNSMLYELFHRQEIETFISKFLTQFARRKGMDVDELFYRHIESVVSDLPFLINAIDIPQEERVICLASHISNVEMKLKSVLVVAKEWPVPWATNIDTMVATCLQLPAADPGCRELQSTINLLRVQVPFRCLLNRYRLSATKVQNYFGVVMALNRIIVTRKPDYYQDCLELIKHTGFVDEEKIRCIEFSLNLRNMDVPVEDLFNCTWNQSLLKRLLARTLHEFKMGDKILYPEEVQRAIDVGKLLANILDDRKAMEFFKLREVSPKLSDPALVYDPKYPFSVLSLIMPEYHAKSSSELAIMCKKVCDITFTHLPDMLSVAAAFYLRPGITPSELNKIWDLVEQITNTPGCILGKNSFLVHSSAVAVAHFLICRCPETSAERLGILLDFLEILTCFDKSIEEVTKMISNVKIFLALRDQEIPLENQFRQIYQWLFHDGVPREDVFCNYLQSFGITTLKFGDKNLFKQVFGCVVKELSSRLSGSEQEKSSIRRFIHGIISIQVELLNSYDLLTEPEDDQNVLDLVELLKKEADIYVTPYAIRQRDKSRFLDRLLLSDHCWIASQVALVFEVFADTNAWSKILQGLMSSGDGEKLHQVLLDLRNVSELWMLPEFAQGWKMVAESDTNFLDLCPIPLD